MTATNIGPEAIELTNSQAALDTWANATGLRPDDLPEWLDTAELEESGADLERLEALVLCERFLADGCPE